MDRDEQAREFEAAAEAIAQEYETRLRDELELALEREEALTAEKLAALEAVQSGMSKATEPVVPRIPAGPAEERYQRAMRTLSIGSQRGIGPAAGLAFIFISYPIGGAILGYVIDRWFLFPRTGEPNYLPMLIGVLLGFYNGIIELLRHSRKLEREAQVARDDQKSRTR